MSTTQTVNRMAGNMTLRPSGPSAQNSNPFLRFGQSGNRLVGVMLTITLAAAIGFVGTKVISEIDSSISVQSGSNFADATDNLSTGFADAMSLSDVVFLVLMFGVILTALLGFSRRT